MVNGNVLLDVITADLKWLKWLDIAHAFLL